MSCYGYTYHVHDQAGFDTDRAWRTPHPSLGTSLRRRRADPDAERLPALRRPGDRCPARDARPPRARLDGVGGRSRHPGRRSGRGRGRERATVRIRRATRLQPGPSPADDRGVRRRRRSGVAGRDRGRARRDPRLGLFRSGHRRRVAASRCRPRRVVGRRSTRRGGRARSERRRRPTSVGGVPGGCRGQPDEGPRRAAAGVAPRVRCARLRCRAPPSRSRGHVPRRRCPGRRVGGRRTPNEGPGRRRRRRHRSRPGPGRRRHRRPSSRTGRDGRDRRSRGRSRSGDAAVDVDLADVLVLPARVIDASGALTQAIGRRS